jgi:hypothetical protein
VTLRRELAELAIRKGESQRDMVVSLIGAAVRVCQACHVSGNGQPMTRELLNGLVDEAWEDTKKVSPVVGRC